MLAGGPRQHRHRGSGGRLFHGLPQPLHRSPDVDFVGLQAIGHLLGLPPDLVEIVRRLLRGVVQLVLDVPHHGIHFLVGEGLGRIGETVRLVCPITGYPTPIVEWSKNGEKIDFMWERHLTGRKSLKIKNANEDDTGVFTCKAINGFGSEEVRIELIVVGENGIYDVIKMGHNGGGKKRKLI